MPLPSPDVIIAKLSDGSADQGVREESTPTTRELAGIYACGKTQVYQILKDKAAIIEHYEANVTSNLSRSLKESRKSPYAEINDLLYQWFFGCSTQEHLS